MNNIFSSFLQIFLATLCLAVSVLGAPRRYYHQRRYYKTQRQPLRGYTASAPAPQISYKNSLNTQRNSASDASPQVSFESYGNGGNSYYILRGASKFVKTKDQGMCRRNGILLPKLFGPTVKENVLVISKNLVTKYHFFYTYLDLLF